MMKMPQPTAPISIIIRPQGSRRVYVEFVDPHVPLEPFLKRFLHKRFNVVPPYLTASVEVSGSQRGASQPSSSQRSSVEQSDSHTSISERTAAPLNMSRTPAQLGLTSGTTISLNWATTMRHEPALNVARRLVEQTVRHLRNAATYGVEGLCYWAAEQHDGQWKITSVMRPRTIMATPVRVDVSAEENKRVEAAVPSNAAIVAQVHSHLGPAFHSDRDDRYPFSLEPGFVSIVVPHGADRAVHWPGGIRIFELQRYPQWREWDAGETRSRLVIAEGMRIGGSYVASHRNTPASSS